MRLLSRALFTFALLGTLAYGSYAFGKYVLSSHLFGPQGEKLKSNFEGTEAGTVTAQGSDITGAPRASVEVLPADNNDPGALPPLSSLERSRRPRSSSPPPATEDVPKLDDSDLNNSASSNDDEDEDRPRRRRRRTRVRATPAPTKAETSETQTARDLNPEDAPSSNESSEPSSSESSSNSNSGDSGGGSEPALAPRVETREEPRPSVEPSEDRPRRRRRQRVRTDSPVVTREDTPRAPARPAPSRRLNESPIPQPETSGGGDSPVPIPE